MTGNFQRPLNAISYRFADTFSVYAEPGYFALKGHYKREAISERILILRCPYVTAWISDVMPLFKIVIRVIRIHD
ncbi:hypothetical protein DIU36_05045 [Mucilaginibacter rubeus]|nr:hypothetical protein DIU36_05045 [Mucilaginibacter rubeus]